MANNDDSDSTSTGTFYYTTANCCSSSDCTSDYTPDGGITWTVRIPPPRKLLVKTPRNWKRGKIDRFAKLVNEETHTGWRVHSLVRVEKIYDPSVEKLTMAQFKALMLQTASAADAAKIEQFFARKA